MTDCCIIGGGVIGLSIARELAGRGLAVRLLAREGRRETASWAAAGIFPPTPSYPGWSAGEAFTAWSDRLHQEWSRSLCEETGIDNELRRCGGLHLAGSEAGLRRLAASAAEWRRKTASCESLDAREICGIEPAFIKAVSRGAILGGLLLPDEMAMRPPRHLEALAESCRHRGVEITADEVQGLEVRDGRIDGVQTRGSGTVRAASYCLAAGAWSGALAAAVGLPLETRPIRGQILLLRLPRQILSRVVNAGLDYFVPRDDGRLLVGSTIEDAGFDASTTEAAVDRLMGVARLLLGELAEAGVEQAWAGLRPGSVDGLPVIGRIPTVANGFVAAGHFRAGLHQSTGTAVLMADLIAGGSSLPSATLAFDAAAFSPERRPRPIRGDGEPARDSVADYLARTEQVWL